jgi:transcriptional regulator with XRE-family HTH domain
MASDPVKLYNHELIARTKFAREATGFSQEEFAGFMGVVQGTWKQYETRTRLPHHMIVKFCSLARCDLRWFLSGQGPAPEIAPTAQPHKLRRLPRH